MRITKEVNSFYNDNSTLNASNHIKKISTALLTEMEKYILKFVGNHNRFQIAKTFLSKENTRKIAITHF